MYELSEIILYNNKAISQLIITIFKYYNHIQMLTNVTTNL